MAKPSNIYEVKHKYTGAWIVRFKKNGVKVNKTYSFDPKLKNENGLSDREIAYQQALTWRNLEFQSITQSAVSIENTSQLTFRTLLEKYCHEVVNGLTDNEDENHKDYEKLLKDPTRGIKGKDVERIRIARILKGDLDKEKTLIDTPIVKLTRDNFIDLRKHLAGQIAPSSANRYMTIFSNILKWAKNELGSEYSWVDETLTSGQHIKVVKKRKDIPASDDLEKVLAETESPYLKIALVLGFETGARRGEIMKTEWKDVVLKRDIKKNIFPHIVFRDLKNGSPTKVVPLSTRAQKLLRTINEEERLGFLFKSEETPGETIRPRSITQAFKRARERAAKVHNDPRLLNIIFHGTRGNFITKTVQIKGMSPATVAVLSGHKDINVLLEHYYDPKSYELAQSMGYALKKRAK